MKLEVASKPLEDDEIVAALAAVVPDSELDVKVFEWLNLLLPNHNSKSKGNMTYSRDKKIQTPIT